MTLRARIYLLVALAVAPAFALLIVDHSKNLQLREAEAESEALRSTWLVSAELDQVFKGVEALLRAAAQSPAVGSFQVPECTEYLAQLERVNPSAGSIIGFDAEGRMRCESSDPSTTVADRDYFREAIKVEGLVVGTFTIGRLSGVPILPLALRMQTSEGPGVLAAGLRLDWLRAHFAERFANLPPNSSLTIVDRNSVMLVRLPKPGHEGKPLPPRYRHVVNAPAPGSFRSAADKHNDGIARFLGFTPLDAPPRGVAIAVGHPQESALAEVRAGAVRNYFLLGLVALLAFLAAAIGERLFIRRPMSELLSTIARWRNQDLTARVKHPSGRTEFGQIGNAFNSMADELGAALMHKDVLLRELSHRVMNSLNTIAASFRLQVRSLKEPSDVSHFQQAIGRIEAMALAYKRMQATQGVEGVEFASFLVELCKDMQSSIMQGNTQCVVNADPVLLSSDQAIPLSLIANELLTNAIKHCSDRSTPVAVRLESSAEHCRLAVRNRGVLRQGYDQVDNTGFGLRMISSMVTQLRGKLEVSSNDGETEFAVTFQPEAPKSPLTLDASVAQMSTDAAQSRD
jgi:two-component sensor histidine kinase